MHWRALHPDSTSSVHLSGSALSLRSCPCHLNVIAGLFFLWDKIVEIGFFLFKPHHSYFRNSLVLQRVTGINFWFPIWIQVFANVCISLVSSKEMGASDTLASCPEGSVYKNPRKMFLNKMKRNSFSNACLLQRKCQGRTQYRRHYLMSKRMWLVQMAVCD